MFSVRRQASPSVQGVTDEAMVYIGEYQALRQEVNNRQTLSYTIVAGQLAAFGAGAAVARDYAPMMLALAGVSTLLWLFWLAQIMQIYRIAAYVALELRPRLCDHYGCSLLGWEGYMRRMTINRDSAARALYGDVDSAPARRIWRNREGVFVSLLLGGAAPLCLTLVTVTQFRFDTDMLLFKFGVFGALLLWLYALVNAVSVLRTTRAIDERIVAAHDESPSG